MFGSHTKSFHPGRAAQCGLLAALLAQGGYTSSESAIEAKRGWANVVGATHPDPQKGLQTWVLNSQLGLTDSTGQGRWEILRNSFKPFPCGIVIHPIIDACAQLHFDLESRKVGIESIKTIHATVHPLVLELTGKKTPKDGLEAKFSVYHGGAVGLIYGKATPSQYEDSIVLDSTVISIRDRITAEASDILDRKSTRLNSSHLPTSRMPSSA